MALSVRIVISKIPWFTCSLAVLTPQRKLAISCPPSWMPYQVEQAGVANLGSRHTLHTLRPELHWIGLPQKECPLARRLKNTCSALQMGSTLRRRQKPWQEPISLLEWIGCHFMDDNAPTHTQVSMQWLPSLQLI